MNKAERELNRSIVANRAAGLMGRAMDPEMGPDGRAGTIRHLHRVLDLLMTIDEEDKSMEENDET